MEKSTNRVVKDFFNGLKVFGLTVGCSILVIVLVIGFLLVPEELTSKQENIILVFIVTMFILSIIFGVIGFVVNYVPVKIVNDIVYIPATDQIRTFTDLITLNPVTGLYRRRSYNVNDIENVANGYTRVKRGKSREWNVVITGLKNGKSFSQRIDCSNKQVRDEVRNALRESISGKVNSDFAI